MLVFESARNIISPKNLKQNLKKQEMPSQFATHGYQTKYCCSSTLLTGLYRGSQRKKKKSHALSAGSLTQSATLNPFLLVTLKSFSIEIQMARIPSPLFSFSNFPV